MIKKSAAKDKAKKLYERPKKKAKAAAKSGAKPSADDAAARRARMMAAAAQELAEIPEPTPRKGAAPPASPAPSSSAAKKRSLEEEMWEQLAAKKPAVAKAAAPAESDEDEAGLVLVKAKTQTVQAEEGVSVAVKGASKFSAADLEMLKKVVVVKGSAAVVGGLNLDAIKWNEEGLAPILVQDRATGAVILLAWGNRDTVATSLKDSRMTYWSRARNKAWRSGDDGASAHKLATIKPDAENAALLAVVETEGPAHANGATAWVSGREFPVAGALGEWDVQIRDEAKAKAKDSPHAKQLQNPVDAVRGLVAGAQLAVDTLLGKGKATPQAAAASLLRDLVVALRAKGVPLDAAMREVQKALG